MFHARNIYITLDIKMGLHPQQIPIPTSQSAQDFLDQTEMIYHDVRENAMQAYTKYKTHYGKFKHDDLYARAWECGNETPIFDTDAHNTAPPDQPEFAVRSY